MGRGRRCPMESPYCGSMFLQPTPHSSRCCSNFQQLPLGTVNAAPFLSPMGTKADTDTLRCKGGACQGADFSKQTPGQTGCKL